MMDLCVLSKARVATEEGDIASLVQLLLHHPDLIHEQYEDGKTLLHLACAQGQLESVATLIQKHANLEAQCDRGYTSLHAACSKSQYDVCQLLVAEAADMEAATKQGYLPIHVAAESGCERLVALLLNSRSKVNSQTPEQTQPIHLASSEGHLRTVAKLIEFGADPNAADRNGCVPLHFACRNGHLGVVELLLRKHAKCDAEDAYGMTPEQLANHQQHIHVVEFLQSNRKLACQNSNRSEGDPSIPYVDEVGEIEINCSKDCMKRQLNAAVQNGSKEKVEAILLQMPSESRGHLITESRALPAACKLGRDDLALCLLRQDADPNHSDELGLTPLHLACERGDLKCVKVLIDNQANIEAKESKAGFGPLHYACLGGHTDVVKELIRHNAIVDAEDYFIQTPLVVAKEGKWDDIVRLLQNSGIEPRRDPDFDSVRPKSAPIQSDSAIPDAVMRRKIRSDGIKMGQNTLRRVLKRVSNMNIESIVVDIFGKETKEGQGVAEQPHQQWIRNNYVKLVENLEPRDVANILFANGRISIREKADVVDVPTHHIHKMNEALLDVLYDKDATVFGEFEAALKETRQNGLLISLK